MGIFERQKGWDINLELQEFRESENDLLIDVRQAEEYAEGHIPGSINIPLSSLNEIADLAPDFGQKIFVYCLSGLRSGKAQWYLNELGYTDVTNIGAFRSYKGTIEK